MKYVCLNNDKYLYAVDYNQIINTAIKGLFIKYGANTKIEWEDVRVDEKTIQAKVRQLKQVVFEVSQLCNLQCSYCVYGGSYYYHRKNSSKSLSFDTSRKVIDFFSEIFGKRLQKELTVGFYGGEPLINFDVIEKIVDYSKKVFPNWVLRFTITTNGTLLDDRMIHFLVKNNFSLMVSLDGNEKNHDSRRIFPDGSGSFHLIIENIEKIKNIDNEYYNERVSFIITYSNDLPIEDVFHFFLSDDRVRMNTVQFSPVNHLDTDYYDRYQYDKATAATSISAAVNRITGKKIQKIPLAPIEQDLFNQFADLDKKLKRRRLSFLSGSCLFDNRLYIDTDGAFHICEKMNDRFPFGDCEKGFDFFKMNQITHAFMDLIKIKCLGCEARFLCSRCYIHFAKNGTFEMDPDFCVLNKKKIKKLEKLIQLKEKGVL
ncbi:MAG TPA: radical SAM protein [Candidatus Kapabacteria bacterium]|nr:radical SAM protein [Candidatus Kapabacteria bacterium]